jgi:hypothetical protein
MLEGQLLHAAKDGGEDRRFSTAVPMDPCSPTVEPYMSFASGLGIQSVVRSVGYFKFVCYI